MLNEMTSFMVGGYSCNVSNVHVSLQQVVLPLRRRQLRQCAAIGGHAAELPLAGRLVPGQTQHQGAARDPRPRTLAGMSFFFLRLHDFQYNFFSCSSELRYFDVATKTAAPLTVHRVKLLGNFLE